MANKDINKFTISGRYSKFPYYCVLISFLTVFTLIYFVYAGYVNWGSIDWIILIMVILNLIVFIGSIYIIYYMLMVKTLLIDNKGVKYYFNGKLKLFLPWKKIEGIEAHGWETKRFILLIFGNGKTINFNNIVFGIPIEDLQEAFNELLKYQPKYNFTVVDEYVKITK